MSEEIMEVGVMQSIRRSLKNRFVREVLNIGLILLVVLAFKSIFIANYTVPTGSMEPSILPGDKLLVNKMAYTLRVPFTDIVLYEFSRPERGDVIVFDYPRDPDLNFVKRLIGLPGDRVEVEDGFITINDKSLTTSLNDEDERWETLINGGVYEEEYGKYSYPVQRIRRPFRDEEISLTVPKGHYFVMGDNRDNSSDSRVWGFVPEKNVKGKAKMIYFSMDWKEWLETPTFRTERIGRKL